jgi:hypothetical protein
MQKIIDYFKQYGVDANTTATILLTLLTFSLGLLLAWLAKRIKELKERQSYKKSLILILKDFSKSCDKQYKIVCKSLETTGLKKGNDFIVKFIPIATLDYLNNLDFNVFLQKFEPIFFRKNYSKAISKLFELIAHIKIQNDSIADFIKYFSEEFKRHEKQYYENIVQLRNIHDTLGVHLDGKPINKDTGGELIQGYFQIFDDWLKNGGNKNITATHIEIVLKVLDLNRNFQKIPLILKTNEHALNCDIAFENIVKIDTMLQDKFLQFAHFHRRASRVTNMVIRIIK